MQQMHLNHCMKFLNETWLPQYPPHIALVPLLLQFYNVWVDFSPLAQELNGEGTHNSAKAILYNSSRQKTDFQEHCSAAEKSKRIYFVSPRPGFEDKLENVWVILDGISEAVIQLSGISSCEEMLFQCSAHFFAFLHDKQKVNLQTHKQI